MYDKKDEEKEDMQRCSQEAVVTHYRYVIQERSQLGMHTKYNPAENTYISSANNRYPQLQLRYASSWIQV